MKCPLNSLIAGDTPCVEKECEWWSKRLDVCVIRVAGESLAGIGVKFLAELKILTTTLISIENKMDYLDRCPLCYHLTSTPVEDRQDPVGSGCKLCRSIQERRK